MDLEFLLNDYYERAMELVNMTDWFVQAFIGRRFTGGRFEDVGFLTSRVENPIVKNEIDGFIANVKRSIGEFHTETRSQFCAAY